MPKELKEIMNKNPKEIIKMTYEQNKNIRKEIKHIHNKTNKQKFWISAVSATKYLLRWVWQQI